MKIINHTLYKEAHEILVKTFDNKRAEFREGQYEAIESVFENKRSLVVQKTGWGKSLVYFISTKINRNRGKGVSIVISPLLVLIDNQIEAAKKVGLTFEMLSSSNKESHDNVIRNLKNSNVDILFTTPESLFNILQPHIKDINIGMFIIDEAHCISDWGHDFRMDYRKIVDIISQLKDKDFPILATTATANDRVIEDLTNQIGPGLYVSRGPLYRDNLKIHLIDLQNRVNRYGWILEHINRFEGTGIIYCLTQRDCENLTIFLKANDVLAENYHSGLEVEVSDLNIDLFYKNKIKVLVSTIKLGMGYDKPDVSFVIHYQVPKNIVSYYQQIGRAARSIPTGYAVMLKGGNDLDILRYFIEEAFPKEKEMKTVFDQFKSNSWDFSENGMTSYKISTMLNYSLKKINKALKFLEFEGILNREKQTYFLTSKPFYYNDKHYQDITNIRTKEIEELESLFVKKECLSKLIIEALDDHEEVRCGKCMNCQAEPYFNQDISSQTKEKVNQFLNELTITIEPKHVYKKENTGINYFSSDKIQYYNKHFGYEIKTATNGKSYVYVPAEYFANESGVALSKYGDEGLGFLVSECKKNNIEYPDEILDKAKSVLLKYIEKNNINTLAFVPSKNNTLVDNIAKKLASYFNLEFMDYFSKVSNTSQKHMTNKYFQKNNVEVSYKLKTSYNISNKNIMLIDDMVDSGWTFAFLGQELLKNGANLVFPVALSDTSIREVDND